MLYIYVDGRPLPAPKVAALAFGLKTCRYDEKRESGHVPSTMYHPSSFISLGVTIEYRKKLNVAFAANSR